MPGCCGYTNAIQLSLFQREVKQRPHNPHKYGRCDRVSGEDDYSPNPVVRNAKVNYAPNPAVRDAKPNELLTKAEVPGLGIPLVGAVSPLRDYRQVGGVGSEPCVLTRWLRRTATEVAHVAALASAEAELSEFFEMCKIAEWTNELALTREIAVICD